MCFTFIGFDLRFESETDRAEGEIQLHARFDSDYTIWFVALAKEQLALISENGFHGISFRLRVLKFSGATGLCGPADCRQSEVNRARSATVHPSQDGRGFSRARFASWLSPGRGCQ